MLIRIRVIFLTHHVMMFMTHIPNFISHFEISSKSQQSKSVMQSCMQIMDPKFDKVTKRQPRLPEMTVTWHMSHDNELRCNII